MRFIERGHLYLRESQTMRQADPISRLISIIWLPIKLFPIPDICRTGRTEWYATRPALYAEPPKSRFSHNRTRSDDNRWSLAFSEVRQAYANWITSLMQVSSRVHHAHRSWRFGPCSWQRDVHICELSASRALRSYFQRYGVANPNWRLLM